MGHTDVLYRPDDRVDLVYFPLTAMLSVLTTTGQGDSVETSAVGNEGALGVLEACGSGRTVMTSLVQVDGAAMRMASSTFRRLVATHEGFGEAAWRLVEHQITESRQSGMCQALHGVEPRLARWLCETHARTGGRNPLPLTQEFIAAMLGVQRTTVTAFAAQLQKAGLISYRRGQVEIIDAAGLEHRSCECRAVLKAQRRRLGLRPLLLSDEARRA
jgi:CRP-like cAMP-binding protein